MAMDHFMEEVVVKKNRAPLEILYVLANISMVAFAILGFMMVSSGITVLFSGAADASVWIGLALGLVLCGAAVLLYLFRGHLRTEYEYTFTNGDMDFAQVFNNMKRKSLGTMRVKNVEAFGPVDSDGFRRYVSMPGIKVSNWFLNRGANLYYFYFQKESNKRLIVLEPSEEMVEMVKKYLPHSSYKA